MDIEVKEKLSEDGSITVALAMPNRLKQLLRKEAFEKEMSFSAVIRFILEKYFRENSAEVAKFNDVEGDK